MSDTQVNVKVHWPLDKSYQIPLNNEMVLNSSEKTFFRMAEGMRFRNILFYFSLHKNISKLLFSAMIINVVIVNNGHQSCINETFCMCFMG